MPLASLIKKKRSLKANSKAKCEVYRGKYNILWEQSLEWLSQEDGKKQNYLYIISALIFLEKTTVKCDPANETLNLLSILEII